MSLAVEYDVSLFCVSFKPRKFRCKFCLFKNNQTYIFGSSQSSVMFSIILFCYDPHIFLKCHMYVFVSWVRWKSQLNPNFAFCLILICPINAINCSCNVSVFSAIKAKPSLLSKHTVLQLLI